MAQVKISRLNDGRVGVALQGESGGFYAWPEKDAVYLAVALMRFFETEEKAQPEPSTSDEYEEMSAIPEDEPVDTV